MKESTSDAGTMKLEQLVDIEAFSSSVTPADKNVFHAWSNTAFEISRDKDEAIVRVRDNYLKIPDTELATRHFITFVQDLLDALSSDEQRKSLIRAEAFRFKKFH